eukprot:6209864-Pleurochrysis_carterae.AAC.2
MDAQADLHADGQASGLVDRTKGERSHTPSLATNADYSESRRRSSLKERVRGNGARARGRVQPEAAGAFECGRSGRGGSAGRLWVLIRQRRIVCEVVVVVAAAGRERTLRRRASKRTDAEKRIARVVRTACSSQMGEQDIVRFASSERTEVVKERASGARGVRAAFSRCVEESGRPDLAGCDALLTRLEGGVLAYARVGGGDVVSDAQHAVGRVVAAVGAGA